MSFTRRTTLGANWVTLTSAGASGIAQLQGDGAVKLHLGQTLPAEDSLDYLTLWENGLTELPFLNSEAGDVLYGKSLDGSTVDVTVTASGVAP